ncbi:hypothetical protein CGZ91_00365 [Parenemella sanctibonifatiensis]|uniref:Uncharacterized protein n=1 Tax=Parenemella sanctibonifatiensis TaxID=2016505 RepID=A0A255EM11_9ACTN|nr:hypothetical protein CGZ91_00365 [Parenemella sanctibonifatiensis]
MTQSSMPRKDVVSSSGMAESSRIFDLAPKPPSSIRPIDADTPPVAQKTASLAGSQSMKWMSPLPG